MQSPVASEMFCEASERTPGNRLSIEACFEGYSFS